MLPGLSAKTAATQSGSRAGEFFSPEHLAKAHDEEVNQWLSVGNKVVLLDAVPASGGSGFIDLRGAPKPPEAPSDGEEPGEELGAAGRDAILDAPEPELSSQTLSDERAASERDARRARKSSEFFSAQEEKRRRRGSKGSATTAASTSPLPSSTFPPTPADIPADPHGLPDLDLEGNEGNMEFDPELHDYHQAIPAPALSPIIEDADGEAREREAKRQRVREESHHANFANEESCEAYLVAESGRYLDEKVVKHYAQHEHAYQALGVSEGDLLFGVHRNDFQKQYEALAATTPNDSGAKKKGRKEILLKDLDAEQKELFCGKGGSDEKEWNAWKTKDACDIVFPS